MQSDYENTLTKSNVMYIKAKCIIPKLSAKVCAILTAFQVITSTMSAKDTLNSAGNVELVVVLVLIMLMYIATNKMTFWLIARIIYPYETIITKKDILIKGLSHNTSINIVAISLQENVTEQDFIYVKTGLKLWVTDKINWESLYVKDEGGVVRKKIITLIGGEGKSEI